MKVNAMNARELLENDKERLLTGLAASDSPERAVRLLDDELSRIQLRLAAQREDASAHGLLLASARAALSLIDSAGGVKVYSPVKAGSGRSAALIPAAAAAGSAAGGALVLALAPAALSPVGMALMAAGAVFAFFAGMRFGAGKPARRNEDKLEIVLDGEKIYHNVKNLLTVVDETAREAENEKLTAAAVVKDAEIPEELLALFSQLLEAACRNPDDPGSKDTVSEIRYYLHRRGIEVLMFDESTRKYFSLMPGVKTRTLRPALVKDNVLLVRGLAAGGM
jgi:hypothetical protein